jgi:putative Holliday junction resolvase
VTTGRLLGVDYGTVRVGLAISDPDRRIASPMTTLVRKGPEADARSLRQVTRNERVVEIVVGLPIHLNGREGVKAIEARRYGAWLGEITGLPIVFADERFTTAHAEEALWGAGLTHRQRKERRDRVAAQMMLQAYLDANCPGNVEIRSIDEPDAPAPER